MTIRLVCVPILAMAVQICQIGAKLNQVIVVIVVRN